MEKQEKKVIEIPPTKKLYADLWRRGGIYCRVSSSKRPQLRSLAAQASGLT